MVINRNSTNRGRVSFTKNILKVKNEFTILPKEDKIIKLAIGGKRIFINSIKVIS